MTKRELAILVQALREARGREAVRLGQVVDIAVAVILGSPPPPYVPEVLPAGGRSSGLMSFQVAHDLDVTEDTP